MKFSSICVALASLASATAFAPSGGAAVSKTALNNYAGVMDGRTVAQDSQTAEWNLNGIGPKVNIQGQTRYTYNFNDHNKEFAQVAVHSNGRPIQSSLDLWVGPDWTPVSIKANSEDGRMYPIQTLIGTRNQAANIEVKNTGPYTMPIQAAAAYAVGPLANDVDTITMQTQGTYMEGGSVEHMSFPAEVEQLQVLIKTEGKQLHAKIELLNGPNNVKQEYEIFTNNGELNSLFVVFDMPQQGYAIRVKNLATLEFPCEIYTKASRVEFSQNNRYENNNRMVENNNRWS